MSNSYVVYLHISPNGKRYYGITQQKPEYRWKNGYGYIKNVHFTNAINLYGWENIKHEIISKNLTELEAKEMESELIVKYKTHNSKYGYNKTFGGEGNIPTEETKKKMSKVHMGKNNPMYGMYGENNPFYNKHHTEDTKRKISLSNTGRKHTSESKLKLSKSNSGSNNPNYGKYGKDSSCSKSVICITTNEIFYSITNASKKYNIPQSNITACCQERNKSAGKHPETGEKMIWAYC